MDDDTIPEPTALERLVEGGARLDGLPEPAMLASKIVWTDGAVHPLNWPGLRLGDMDLFLRASERGVLPLRWNTFPSTLIRREALERHGLPLKHFWIWSDDIEHSARLLRDEVGYVVPDSVAHHKTASAYPPWEGGERFYYAVRNGLYILRGSALARSEKQQQAFAVLGQIVRFLRHERLRPASLRIVARGLRDGVTGPAS
jgi:GT2 family glycosyltransferase